MAPATPVKVALLAPAGEPPVQLLLRLKSVVPGFHVTVAPMMDCAIVRSARMRGIVVRQLRWLRSLE